MKKIILLFFFTCGSKNFFAKEFRILVLGDTGTGWGEQMRVAKSAYLICHPNGINLSPSDNVCDIGLLLGDNFYLNGVSSPHDQQFNTEFKYPYEPLQVPFWVTLGNHDWGVIWGAIRGGWSLALNRQSDSKGNVIAQTEYKGSQWWKFPNYSDEDGEATWYGTQKEKWNELGIFYEVPPKYFSKQYGLKENTLSLFSLDTTKLEGGENIEQTKWFIEKLKASKARWKIAFSHHTLFSFSNGGLTDSISPIMQKDLLDAVCDNLDFYIAGHDHGTQIVKITCPNSEHGKKRTPVFQIITGAAGWTWGGAIDYDTSDGDILVKDEDGDIFTMKLEYKLEGESGMNPLSYVVIDLDDEKDNAKVKIYSVGLENDNAWFLQQFPDTEINQECCLKDGITNNPKHTYNIELRKDYM